MDLARMVIEVVRERKPTFDELRDEIERRGIFIDSRVLRSVVADLVRSRVLCKEWDPNAKRFRLLLCIEP
ncbi:MAG: hypothetical protein GXO32_05495 [Crenarchaeota archaeon]|nr:hypothetical protein [Thermoproteota archaeon]